MEDMNATLNRFRLETMMMERSVETQNATLTYFEEPQESHNFNFEASMEDFDEELTHSRLESMMEHVVEAQTVLNEEFSKQSIHFNETLRQMTTMVESLATQHMALEAQISL